MEPRPFYHDGMRALQDRFDGRRVADGLAARRRRTDFWDEDRRMIQDASFFFIATSYGEHVDCSMRAGAPGFIRIVGPGVLEFPEYDGNSMYRRMVTLRMPSDCAASTIAREIWESAAWVLRTMGSSAYRASAR